MAQQTISVVMPTFNEQDNIEEMSRQLTKVFEPLDVDHEFIFVDDNSLDGSKDTLERLHAQDPRIKYVIMSRRYGDQPCLMAGLQASMGDAVIIMDADLQHPPRYIPQMIERWKQGCQVLVMRREEAAHTNFFKKWTEIWFYKILSRFSTSPIIQRFAGYALMDRAVVNALTRFNESDLFLRGLVAFVGFTREEMIYIEDERTEGHSKYGITDMSRLALAGFTSFSDFPLYLPLYVGLAVMGVTVLGAMGCGVAWYLGHWPWSLFWSLVAATLLFVSGVQLTFLGVLGLYTSKTIKEVRNRPRYIVAERGGVSLE